MNKTIIAGLSALVLSSCETTTDAELSKYLTIPKDCAEVISLSRGYRGNGFDLSCKTADGTFLSYHKYFVKEPWQRYELKKEE